MPESARRLRQLKLKKNSSELRKDRLTDPTSTQTTSDAAALEDDALQECHIQQTRSSMPRRGRPLLDGKESDDNIHGVVLLNRLPRGFAEPQLRKFFSQFGDVLRVRLIRSKKTTNSKGYGFVEFASREVAQIAAETMNGYMMFGTVMKARLLPLEAVPKQLFTHYRKRLKRGYSVDAQRRALLASEENVSHKRAKRFVAKEEKCVARLRELGIEFQPTRFTASQKHGLSEATASKKSAKKEKK